MIKLILFCQRLYTRRYFIIILIKDLCCQLFYSYSKLICYRLHCFSCRICISVCKILFVYQPKYICRTSICKTNFLSVLKSDYTVVGRISFLRTYKFNLRIHYFLFRRKTSVLATCYVS